MEQYGEGSGRRRDRVATGSGKAAVSQQVISRPLIPFRDVAIFSHHKKGWT